MFTVEFDQDETCITILDDTGELDDVDALLYEDYCHIRQFNERTQRYEVITLTPTMYLKLMKAFEMPEGTYDLSFAEIKKRKKIPKKIK